VKRTSIIIRKRGGGGGGNHTQNSTSWRDLPVIRFTLLRATKVKNHHHAKAYVPLSVQYQTSWKFYIHLHVGFPALHSEHSIFAVVRHSLVRRNYRVILKTLRDVRPLQYSSQDGHDEREHVNRGRDIPSFCPTLQVLDMSTLLCPSRLLRSRFRKFRRDLRITLYSPSKCCVHYEETINIGL
jgi:hypothetical protein